MFSISWGLTEKFQIKLQQFMTLLALARIDIMSWCYKLGYDSISAIWIF